MPPTVVANLIREEIEPMIDDAAWRRAIAKEARSRRLLDAAAKKWTMVEKILKAPRGR